MNYFDCHADTLTEINIVEETLYKNRREIDLDRVNQFAQRYGQIFAIWKNMKDLDPQQVENEFFNAYHTAISLINQQKDHISLCLSSKDMDAAFQAGKAAAFLSIEDISLMGKHVDQIKELGFRFAILTWNHENQYGYGAVCNQSKGLSADGRGLVSKLLSQGIIIDISHLSDQGVDDLFEISDHPVIASHSNVREICNHPRNLRKEQIQELVKRGGLIGLNFFRPFVSSDPAVTINHLIQHLDYILELGGEDVIAIGSDFDGGSGMFPESLVGVQSIPSVRSFMEKAGLSSSSVDKIMFDNAYNFLNRSLP